MFGVRGANYRYESPRLVRAIRFIREMPGSSRAVLVEADDGNRYTVKTAHRTAAPRLLANEYIATRLAGALHLPIAPFAIVQLTLPFLRSNFAAIKRTGSDGQWFVPAEAFGSLTEAADANWWNGPASALRAVNRDAFAPMLLFDLWTANLDTRQVVFQTREDRTWVKMIDQGHCFKAGDWESLTSTRVWPLFCHGAVYSAVSTWRAFEPQLGRIESVEAADVLGAAESMPPQWCPQADLTGLADALLRRAAILRDRVTEVLVARSDLFPNWFRARAANSTGWRCIPGLIPAHRDPSRAAGPGARRPSAGGVGLRAAAMTGRDSGANPRLTPRRMTITRPGATRVLSPSAIVAPPRTLRAARERRRRRR